MPKILEFDEHARRALERGVEITEELKADVGPTIGLTAQQAPENRGVLGSPIVARATLDIGG